MQAPKLPSFVKGPKAKPFSFKPRYYDERKENLRKMQESGRKQKGILFNRNSKKQVQLKSSKRLFIIIIALFLLAYLLLY